MTMHEPVPSTLIPSEELPSSKSGVTFQLPG